MSNSTDTLLRYAFIGGGASIAATHYEALKKIPGSQVVALSDVAIEKGQAKAAELGATFFDDHNAMLDTAKPDIVVITTPHPSHPQLTIDTLAAGMNVLVEKPIAVEVQEGDAMVAAAKASGKIAAVNFQHRFRPDIEYMKEFITSGQLGDLVRVLMIAPWFRTQAYFRTASWRGTWKGEGGGVMMNQAPHHLDLLCHLVGSPRKIYGWARTQRQPIQTEDTAQAMLEFSNGAPGFLYGTTVEAGPEQFTIVGDKAALNLAGGQLTVTRFEKGLREFGETAPGMWDSPKSVSDVVPLPKGGGDHEAVHRDLREAVLTGGKPRVSVEEGLKSLEVANAIFLSSHLDRPVTLPLDRQAYHRFLEEKKGL